MSVYDLIFLLVNRSIVTNNTKAPHIERNNDRYLIDSGWEDSNGTSVNWSPLSVQHNIQKVQRDLTQCGIGGSQWETCCPRVRNCAHLTIGSREQCSVNIVQRVCG